MLKPKNRCWALRVEIKLLLWLRLNYNRERWLALLSRGLLDKVVRLVRQGNQHGWLVSQIVHELLNLHRRLIFCFKRIWHRFYTRHAHTTAVVRSNHLSRLKVYFRASTNSQINKTWTVINLGLRRVDHKRPGPLMLPRPSNAPVFRTKPLLPLGVGTWWLEVRLLR